MKRLFVLAAATIFTLGVSDALAQRSTEMYIPIGQSPGVSGKSTAMGTITKLKLPEQLLSCSYGSTTISAKITAKTRIWIDRSKLKLPNLKGSLQDCTPGRLVEVKYINNVRSDAGEADWIKIEAKSE